MNHVRVLCWVAGIVGWVVPAQAQHLVPAAPVQITPDQLTWMPYSGGGVQAFLLGSPSSEGTYVVRLRLPAGLRLAPHFHPDGRIVQVVSGTMYFAYGTDADTAKLQAFPVGSLCTEPPDAPHVGWARDGEVVLQVVGTGPSGSHPATAPR